ncbi:MAG: phosphoribosylanthranilate isomerase [Gammaproteobacteria bacterium]|nr:phosphoribosylanthranilate isomerase [Gammaproteobacteria bacterium]
MTDDATDAESDRSALSPRRARARTRVKICGITRLQDGLAACDAGADAIGLVFYAPSPRSVDVEQAASIRAQLPPFVTVVGLFVNEDEAVVARTAERVALDCLQFHGNESPQECERFGLPYMKAVRMGDDVDVEAMARKFASARALVLDTQDDKLWGGSGRTFDWNKVPARIDLPLVIAGGLNPANVAEVIARLHPYGVDVSGGVERSPGIKDAGRIEQFIREVDRVTVAERAG